jgi:hypothetical protein
MILGYIVYLISNQNFYFWAFERKFWLICYSHVHEWCHGTEDAAGSAKN